MLMRTRCPIDGSNDSDVEVYPANFELDAIDATLFSARRTPDRIHYRMVRNRKTGCLRADPVLDDATVRKLYRESKVNYEAISDFTLATYLRYAQRVWPLLPDRRGVLEIGCGHGFFLERMRKKGFRILKGVEPSADARAKAPDWLREHIHGAFLEEDTYPPEAFSLVAAFQVLDHVMAPNELLRNCRKALCPGGLMYWICHDIGSPLARLLGRYCPMIDIEHVVLYDRRTIRMLFEKNGFEVMSVFGAANAYPLEYWHHLAPLPGAVKGLLGGFMRATGLSRFTLKANLGNMGIIARKPPGSPTARLGP